VATRDGLKKRGGSPYWHMRTKLNYKEYQKSSGTTKRTEAKKIRDKWIEELKQQINFSTPGSTKVQIKCIQMFGMYQKKVRNNWKGNQHPENAKKDFLRNVDYWTTAIGEETYMNEIILEDIIQDYKENRQDNGISEKTINIEIGFLRAAYKNTKKRKKYLLCDEPVWTDYITKVVYDEDHSMTDREVGLILLKAKPHAQGPLFARFIGGLRKTDQMRTCVEDIDWERGYIKFTIKGNKYYELPLTDELIKLFSGQKIFENESDENHQARLKNMNLTQPGRIFLYKGKPFDSIRRTYKTTQRELGFKKIYREHDTRHTTANLIGDSEKVMKTYAHSDIKTSRIYDKSDFIVRTESLKKIGDRVGQIVGQIKNEENDDAENGRIVGRGERIRTFDPLVPKIVHTKK